MAMWMFIGLRVKLTLGAEAHTVGDHPDLFSSPIGMRTSLTALAASPMFTGDCFAKSMFRISYSTARGPCGCSASAM